MRKSLLEQLVVEQRWRGALAVCRAGDEPAAYTTEQNAAIFRGVLPWDSEGSGASVARRNRLLLRFWFTENGLARTAEEARLLRAEACRGIAYYDAHVAAYRARALALESEAEAEPATPDAALACALAAAKRRAVEHEHLPLLERLRAKAASLWVWGKPADEFAQRRDTTPGIPGLVALLNQIGAAVPPQPPARARAQQPEGAWGSWAAPPPPYPAPPYAAGPARTVARQQWGGEGQGGREHGPTELNYDDDDDDFM